MRFRFRFRRPKAAVTPVQCEVAATDAVEPVEAVKAVDPVNDASPARAVGDRGAFPTQQKAPDAELCGNPTKSGGSCRWNVAAKGPCLSHRKAPDLLSAFDRVAAPSAARRD
jgi:hypothetical protein